MAFRACFAFLVVIYMAVVLVQFEVSAANDATTATTGAESNTTNSNSTERNEAVVTTESTGNTTKTAGVGGMYPAISLASYALCSAIFALM